MPCRLEAGFRDNRGYIGIIGVILGSYEDTGKENGNYYLGFGVEALRLQGLGVRRLGFRVLVFRA